MPDIKQVTDAVERSNQVYDLPIEDEFGQPYVGKDGVTPATIGIVGTDSKRYREAAEELGRTVAKLSRVEQEKIDWRRALAACGIVRWSGWWNGTGEDLPCERVHVEAVLRAGHVIDQVEAAIKRHASFFVTRSTS